MKYFNYFNQEEKKLFYKLPEYFDKTYDINILKYAIGALLYIPAINKEMLYKAIDRKNYGIASMAICLEDSIGVHGELESIDNIKNLFNYLKNRQKTKEELPLVFIRFRNAEQMVRFSEVLEENLDLLTGVIIPKANNEVISEFLDRIDDLKCNSLYIMPIIETTEFVNIKTKDRAFQELYKVVKENKHRILNIRIGVTDMLGAYGLRRNKKLTIYDNIIFNEFCTNLISTIGGNDDIDIPISGGVSEFYDLKNKDILDSYMKEIYLDKLNTFIGKTVIHPLQLKVVQAMHIISYEDYVDAKDIIKKVDYKCGVSSSFSSERMNEVNTHLKWAKKIMILAEIYGVFNEGKSANELFEF
ncbi:HpcH/HpaI aldolase/citrate lyase family protein [Clostridium sp. OS1-26]|uniref:HpcH/HpaI aldolase/citrate lyase family protein n=1 Tax=Clostridium sp. OS1-26 TaxID=3070681 RepID=UPI0027E157D2|nr:HpcH/HpaI aldolase/citrate lyase family protein [Clostridium sp. OS1-26]WML36886.1 HpcH/HpaI aldolase/citrate lyase family protein [Clostridium sp. OS1-26]